MRVRHSHFWAVEFLAKEKSEDRLALALSAKQSDVWTPRQQRKKSNKEPPLS